MQLTFNQFYLKKKKLNDKKYINGKDNTEIKKVHYF